MCDMECIRRRFRAVFKPNEPVTFRGRRASSIRRADALPKPPKAPESYTASEVDGGKIRDALKIKTVDVCLSDNGALHKTDRFEMMTREKKPQLVVRRGQPFRIEIKTDREYSDQHDALSFIFTVAGAQKPNFGDGTLVPLPLLPKTHFSNENTKWSAIFEKSGDNKIVATVTPAADCIVGEWKMDIDTKLKDNGALSYTVDGSIFILFNPWCLSDQVYMEGEEKRKEYVLNDTGLIWRGSYNRLQPSVWKYAQYEKDVLECSLYILTKVGRLMYSSCSDPVKIARALSAAVNAPDDNGCILGNWTSEFDGGTAPSKWVGSMKILQKYYKYKKPVKYGQCWVFSGVLTTICRTLGIPSRIVTCYSAAHDTHNSLTVDYFVDESGEIMEELNSDSIWNYHVWNEVWMKRPDLGSSWHYDGWQVVDATPQELSDNMYRCGPASVAAVKDGEVLRPHDTAFVYAEVNADKVFWRYYGPTQPLKLLRKDMNAIGQLISTKAVGRWMREDITPSYKYPEESEEERASMLKALKQSASLFSRYYLNEEFNDIKFDFKLRDDIVIGSPFTVVVALDNTNRSKEYDVSLTLRVDSVLYTGKLQDTVKKEVHDVKVKSGTVEEVSMKVTYDEYRTHLVDQAAFNIACLATVKDTNFEYFAQDDFRVRKPDIHFKIDGELILGTPLNVTASLKNPLPVPLRKAEFLIEGPGLSSQLKIKLSEPIQPNEDAKVTFQLKPKFPGRSSIVAKFTSKELDDVDGYHYFRILDKGDNNGLSNTIPT